MVTNVNESISSYKERTMHSYSTPNMPLNSAFGTFSSRVNTKKITEAIAAANNQISTNPEAAYDAITQLNVLIGQAQAKGDQALASEIQETLKRIQEESLPRISKRTKEYINLCNQIYTTLLSMSNIPYIKEEIGYDLPRITALIEIYLDIANAINSQEITPEEGQIGIENLFRKSMFSMEYAKNHPILAFFTTIPQAISNSTAYPTIKNILTAQIANLQAIVEPIKMEAQARVGMLGIGGSTMQITGPMVGFGYGGDRYR